jgi:hypothetical protein
MPGSVKSIILGGGIAAGVPATLGNIPQFSGATPPDLLVDSILRQTQAGTPAIVVGTTDPDAAATETFRTTGGIVSEGAGDLSVVMGAGALVGALTVLGGMAVGTGATVGVTAGAMNDSMAIGNSTVISSPALATGAFQSAIVAIGPRNVANSTGGQPSEYVTIVGAGNSVTSPVGSTNGQITVLGQFNTLLSGLHMVVLGNSWNLPSQVSNCVCIGNGSSVTPAINGCVLIGDSVTMAGGNFATVIGRTAAKSGANGDYAVALGFNAIVNNIDFGIAIGAASRAQGSSGNIAIGRAAVVAHADAAVIGPGSTSERTNCFLIGSDNTGGDYRTYIFGNRGDTVGSGIQNVLWRPTDADGVTSDLVGSSLTIRAGLGSGNGVVSSIDLSVPLIGASGATVQTARVGARVQESVTARDTYLFVWDVDNGVLERVSVGIADSGGVGFKLLRIAN